MTEARKIIAKFGGIRPMARRLGLPHTTVQGWLRYNGEIPRRHRSRIRDAAFADDIRLPKDFLNARTA